ncbi:MAG: protease complex subunit PrcB family protein [Candidatus Eisenbacteria bacterium]
MGGSAVLRGLAALLLVALCSCQEQGPEPARRSKMVDARTIAFVPVGGGPFGWSPRASGYGPQCLLIRSRAAWAELAGSFSMDPGQTPAESDSRIRSVDFARQSLLVLTLGETGSTGYSISLERIEAGPPLKVVTKLHSPDPTDMTGAAMTHPFAIVVVDAISLPKDAVFERDGKVVEVERTVRQ